MVQLTELTVHLECLILGCLVAVLWPALACQPPSVCRVDIKHEALQSVVEVRHYSEEGLLLDAEGSVSPQKLEYGVDISYDKALRVSKVEAQGRSRYSPLDPSRKPVRHDAERTNFAYRYRDGTLAGIEVTERYLDSDPITGGSVERREITQVTLERQGDTTVWRRELIQPDGLAIPQDSLVRREEEGLLVEEIRRRSDGLIIEVRRFIYDANSQLTRILSTPCLPSATCNEPEITHFGYDSNGRLTELRRGKARMVFRHDGDGRLINIDRGRGSLIYPFLKYRYDEDGRVFIRDEHDDHRGRKARTTYSYEGLCSTEVVQRLIPRSGDWTLNTLQPFHRSW